MRKHTRKENQYLKKYFQFHKNKAISDRRKIQRYLKQKNHYKNIVTQHGLHYRKLNQKQSESKWNVNRRVCKIENYIDWHSKQLNNSQKLSCKLVLKLIKTNKNIENIVYKHLENKFKKEQMSAMNAIDNDWDRCIAWTIMVIMLGLSWRAVSLICEKVRHVNVCDLVISM